MLFSKYEELSLKGFIGQLFFYIRYALCLFPIGSLIICIFWAIKTSSKNWSTIVNNSILILCIIIMILSVASFVFILFAAISLFQKLEKLFTYLYFFITLAAFIVSFVLLSFGNSSHEISYLSQFNKACGQSHDAPLTFPTPTIPPPTPSPIETPTPSSTPSPSIPPTLRPLKNRYSIPQTLDKKHNLEEYNTLELFEDAPSPTPSFTPLSTPQPTQPPKNFSESDFCLSHWTSWSRKRYIRERTIDIKNAFAGIISPWVILFCIEFLLILALNPPEFLRNIENSAHNDEGNGLLDENLLPDHQSQDQTQENANTQLGVDSIFRDEDSPGDDNTHSDFNL